MRTAFHALPAQPGGWSASELRTSPPQKVGPMAVAGSLLIFVFPFFMYGSGYGLRLNLLILAPALYFLATAHFRNWIFQEVPPNLSCVWPRDPQRDSVRSYQNILITVTSVWIASTLVFMQCVEFMQYGMGDQWNPFTREIRLTNGGPFREYGLVQSVMLAGGFFAISGLLWWPMYVFFEWLSVKKQAEHSEGASNA